MFEMTDDEFFKAPFIVQYLYIMASANMVVSVSLYEEARKQWPQYFAPDDTIAMAIIEDDWDKFYETQAHEEQSPLGLLQTLREVAPEPINRLK